MTTVPQPDDQPDVPGPRDPAGQADGPVEAPDAAPDARPHAHAHADGPALSTHDRLLVTLLGTRTLLLGATRRARLTGWLWPLAVTLLGGVLRFWDLGRPHELVFDETYYVKQAYSLLTQGFEGQWGDDANAGFVAGDASALRTSAEYVVHPPVGKWLIALGMHLGGGFESSAAWRLASAVAGTLAVLMVARIGRRLFASTALGTVAGLLMAVDGEAIVHSRTGLLDGFVMVFALAAFGALLLDRDQARRRLAARTAALLDSGAALGLGPRLGVRWWRFAAAVLLGLCIGTKWSGLYFLAVFGLLSVAWDASARRSAGVRHWLPATLWRDAVPAGLVMVLTAAVTYVATWWSWFAHPGSYLRQWAEEHPGEGVTWLPPALRSLWHFHTEMWQFHTTLTAEHAYAAHPLGWILQWRPTSFYYPKTVSGLTGDAAELACGAGSCSQAITSLGNPVIWWLGALAVLVALWWLLVRRDWRAGAVLSGIVAGWVPWFAYAHRTIFTFYSIAFTPWVVLTLVYVLALLVQSRDPVQRRRGVVATTGVLVVVLAVSTFFYPVWTAWVVPYDFWHLHMWLPSWI
ncbi:dolichyl-phosphate-mannose--protein mannosyltransferase [Cellulomonas hominis]|uniref:dolichyl-phosphate-mannose--protein mannosyltransferase n=1 Tax=Cellulomonas hominis TaxID=156981 RepID=UPI001B9D481F|nr:glycosyltransferase family 39 protein [Cellulomonas hominis]VTR78689.1 putative dolichyl-phosphate-mannose--protein mannosyltransferase [Cellulomonas hominis]